MKLKGVLFSVLSAVIFGTSPIFFKTIVTLGINTTTQVVVRSVITMILAALLAKRNNQPILLRGRMLMALGSLAKDEGKADDVAARYESAAADLKKAIEDFKNILGKEFAFNKSIEELLNTLE